MVSMMTYGERLPQVTGKIYLCEVTTLLLFGRYLFHLVCLLDARGAANNSPVYENWFLQELIEMCLTLIRGLNVYC